VKVAKQDPPSAGGSFKVLAEKFNAKRERSEGSADRVAEKVSCAHGGIVGVDRATSGGDEGTFEGPVVIDPEGDEAVALGEGRRGQDIAAIGVTPRPDHGSRRMSGTKPLGQGGFDGGSDGGDSGDNPQAATTVKNDSDNGEEAGKPGQENRDFH
jgi:hypothetical protein